MAPGEFVAEYLVESLGIRFIQDDKGLITFARYLDAAGRWCWLESNGRLPHFTSIEQVIAAVRKVRGR